MRHIVTLEIIPSVAVIKLLYSPLEGFLIYTHPSFKNCQQFVPILSVIILLHKFDKARPVLRKRIELNLALIKFCAVCDKTQEKILCSGCTLFGQPFVMLKASLGRCPGLDGDAVDMLRAIEKEADCVYSGGVVQVGGINVNLV